MKTAEFDYNLPAELIAQNPLIPRDSARMLVYDRGTGGLGHRHISDLVEILNSEYVLVFNQSAVFPARLEGRINNYDGELLLLREVKTEDERVYWSAMVKPGKRFVVAGEFVVADDFFGRVESITGDVSDYSFGGNRLISFPRAEFWEKVMRYGKTPLPPYIHKSTASSQQYQTVFAQEQGSVAAPTAGLHFTEELLVTLCRRGLEILFVTLHVGAGTFKPVTVEKVEEHRMHREFFSLTPETALALNQAKQAGKKIIAVGTTTVRVLESCVQEQAGRIVFQPQTSETEIFIYPGYKWRAIDGLLTNFHLPKSSLLMLVAALIGREKLFELYQEAIRQKYRFFSFGDAMLIL